MQLNNIVTSPFPHSSFSSLFFHPAQESPLTSASRFPMCKLLCLCGHICEHTHIHTHTEYRKQKQILKQLCLPLNICSGCSWAWANYLMTLSILLSFKQRLWWNLSYINVMRFEWINICRTLRWVLGWVLGTV